MEGARRSVAARLASNVPGAMFDGTIAGIKFLGLGLLALVLLFGTPILLFQSVNPPGSMLMVQHRVFVGTPIDHRWVPLDAVSPNVMHAMIASEDSGFCGHRGVDWGELQQAVEAAESRGDDVRGASTITMQVAKNLLLWPSRSYVRKGLEIPLALTIERVWSKRRIMEIYVNIVELGPATYGIEAAARRHFKKPAARLTATEAALLAVALPAPVRRNAGKPLPQMQRLARVIEERVRRSPRLTRCLGITAGETKPRS